jgi:Holliday junction resolvase RusA-like endonuclease
VIKFRLDCIPPSSTSQGKRINRSTGVFFTSKAHREDMEMLEALMSPHRPKTPLEGPLDVQIVAVWPWPKSARKSDQEKVLPKTTKPDADNFSKGVIDCLMRLGFFTDDSKISHLSASKWYGTRPCIWITIKTASHVLGEEL